MFRFSFGSYVMDQRSGDGRWLSICSSDICCLCCTTIEFCGNSTSMKELEVDGLPANVGIGIVSLFCLSSLGCPCGLWNWSSFSLWCARVKWERIGSFAEDRSLTWSTTSFESLVLMIPFSTMLIKSLSLSVTKFKNSIWDWTKFYYLWPRSHRMISWKVCTNWEYVSVINSKPN